MTTLDPADRQRLRDWYVREVGYDPMTDDPSMTDADLVGMVSGFATEAGIPDPTTTPVPYIQQWQSDLRAAVNARDGEGMASMMKNHDPNGCYSYADCVEECGVTTRDEWIDLCIQTATDIYLTDEYRNDCN